MPQDAKYAAEQAEKNMKAIADQVFLSFPGIVGEVKGNKVVAVADKQKVAEDRVLRLSFLGIKYDFKPGDEHLVPRMAAKSWMRQNQLDWQDKVVLVMKEKESQKEMEARIRAELKAEIRAEDAATEDTAPVAEEASDEAGEAPKRKPGRPKKS